MEAGSVLGLPDMRAAFLVHLPATQSREGEARGCGRSGGKRSQGRAGRRVVTAIERRIPAALWLDDDDGDDFDEDEDLDPDEDEDTDEADEDEDEEPETWQVRPAVCAN